MVTITYAVSPLAGFHTVAMHDGANLREVVYDGANLLIVAEADVSNAPIVTTIAVVRATSAGVATPPGLAYVGAAPIGVLGTVAVVYR